MAEFTPRKLRAAGAAARGPTAPAIPDQPAGIDVESGTHRRRAWGIAVCFTARGGGQSARWCA